MIHTKEILSVDEFREIRDNINKKLFELEEIIMKKKISQEDALDHFIHDIYAVSIQKLQAYDLSRIPSIEWKNFICYSKDDFIFDLSGTGANLDFSIIEDFNCENYRLQGCNISHLEDVYSYDFRGFDQEIIDQNFEFFLDNRYDEDFRNKYCQRELTFEDYFSLDENLRNLLPKKYDYFFYEDRDIFGMIGGSDIHKGFLRMEEFIKTYPDYRELFYLITHNNILHYNFDPFLLQKNLQILPVSELKGFIYKALRSKVLTCYRINLEDYTDDFIDSNKDIFLTDSSISDEVRNRYYNRKSSLVDVIDHYDSFKNIVQENLGFFEKIEEKEFVRYHVKELDDLIMNHPKFLKKVIESEIIWKFVSNLSTSVKTTLYEKNKTSRELDLYLAYIHDEDSFNYSNMSLEEVLSRRDDRSREENELLDSLISYLGLENILRFEEETGFFTKSQNYNTLYNLEFLSYVIKNGILNENSYLERISLDSNDYNRFRQAIYQAILLSNTKDYSFSYRQITGSFRNEFPDLFISPDDFSDVSQDEKNLLIQKFYDGLLNPEDVRKYPILINVLKGKNLAIPFRGVSGIRENSFGDSFLELCSIYGKYMELFMKFNYYSDRCQFINNPNFSIEKKQEMINKELYSLICKGSIKYGEDMPNSFRMKYPRLFLPNDVPQFIKHKFYNRDFTFEDFKSNLSLIKYFVNTDIMCGFDLSFSKLIGLHDEKDDLLEDNFKKLKIALDYSKISSNDYEIQSQYIAYVSEKYDEVDDKSLQSLREILGRLIYSNSSKLTRLRDQLIFGITHSENPIEALNKVEDLYLKNHLPDVVKTYEVFRILHTDSDGRLKLNTNCNSSPVLLNHSPKMNEVIIFSDLIKASIDSNNKSIRSYINNIREGDCLYKEFLKNHFMNFSPDEEARAQKKLTDYSKMLIAIYNESSKDNPYQSSGDPLVDIGVCMKKFSPNGDMNYDVTDRLTRMFCYFAGFDNYQELISYMDRVKDNADKRNRERVKEEFVLHKGDLIKGLNNSKYLFATLQNGAVATEFLGGSASEVGDSTPLDTDLSYVMADEIDLNTGISKSISNYYGPVWVILESNDSDIMISRDIDDQKNGHYNRKKIELFKTLSPGHFGIRTGFGSSHISYIVANDYDSRMGFDVVRNGFYIPIVDKRGNLLFTPDDYDLIRSQMSGLSYYNNNTYQFSDKLMIPKILELVPEIEKDRIQTTRKGNIIKNLFQTSLQNIPYQNGEHFSLLMKDFLDGDLSTGVVEVIDTGSTGRGTNEVGDSDFDYMFRIDSSIIKDSTKFDALKMSLSKALNGSPNGNGDFRLKKVSIEGISGPIDIDISFTPKKDDILYTTDMCLKERLSFIRKQDPEKYKYVLANIVYAKKVLKEAGCYYKRGHSKWTGKGGLGGVGVENWILQHGGSFIEASESFLRAATNQDGKLLSFGDFKNKYQVWDFGENFEADGRYPHDEFIYNNMDSFGYKEMCSVLSKILNDFYAKKEVREMFSEEHINQEILNVKS